MKNTLFFFIGAMLMDSCSPKISTVSIPVPEEAVAFPGAEGYGRYATGGRGGNVHVVSNLDDSGDGSLRAALGKSGRRMIVFAVSGTIHLQSPLNIKSNTTIAGQTAPGDGICIADHPVKVDGDNVIIRYMRFRMGDRYQNKGKVPGSGHDDALSVYKQKNVIIDHCSLSWSTDEILSAYGGDSITLQWNIISEPLNYSYHFEKGDTDYQQHGYGGIWGGKHLTAHHNLFAHCVSRTPRFDGVRNFPGEFVDYRNNVIYNWAQNNIYAGEGGSYNIVNNYYKAGPSTRTSVRSRIVNPYKKDPIPFGTFYVAGNFVDGFPDVSDNNILGVVFNNGTEEEKNNHLLLQPIPSEAVQTQTAQHAYELVLASAGASFRRDTLDERIVNDARNKTGRIIDVQGGYQHGTPYEISKTAWPPLMIVSSPLDRDKDGMPDEWERKNGLNPSNAADASATTKHKFYTNIELYINSIVKH